MINKTSAQSFYISTKATANLSTFNKLDSESFHF